MAATDWPNSATTHEPTLTLRDIGHDAAATREQNASRVLAALPGTASTLARATGLAYIAVADAAAIILQDYLELYT
jgi:hypothetical protein